MYTSIWKLGHCFGKKWGEERQFVSWQPVAQCLGSLRLMFLTICVVVEKWVSVWKISSDDLYATKKTKSLKSFQPEIHLMSNIHKYLKSLWLTLYNVFLIISIFISSKSCSEMHSTKNGARDQINNYFISLCLYSTIKKREERILAQQNY